jgi:hypothetical protein
MDGRPYYCNRWNENEIKYWIKMNPKFAALFKIESVPVTPVPTEDTAPSATDAEAKDLGSEVIEKVRRRK